MTVGKMVSDSDRPHLARSEAVTRPTIATMDIYLNGNAQSLRDGADVAELLNVSGYADKRVAVEVNLMIVPKSQHAGHALRAGDRVEIVHAMGGG